MKQTVIGIDVGGTTTKIVGFRKTDDREPELIAPQFVRATDPLTSVYGAFGKFTAQNGLELSDIDRILTTGAGSTFVTKPIYNLDCRHVPEFNCIGLGGLWLSGLTDAIVVSMGTGTALIHARHNGKRTETEYLGGTGMGGGTLVGLCRKLLGVDNVEHIEQLAVDGDLANIDLRIKDISRHHLYDGINENLTASNFGNVSDLATPSDMALGITNMIAETVAMLSIFAARSYGIRDIVLTGNLTAIEPIRRVFDGLSESFGVKFHIPENAQFGTVIGAALSEFEG
ncbi:MAG: pantothenate kinase [Clostridia bacterium]|nr:pantothenate kinase [Clostridia bacterium]